MKPIVSVCIPVFESEKFLEECLESVANQNFKELEILICDDFSSGVNNLGKNCKQIVKEFCKKYKKLKVEYIRHQQNKGLVEVRRTLVYVAKGKYILMVDSDDFLAENCIKNLYEAAENHSADIVHGKSKSFFINENGDFVENQTKVNLVFEGELLDKQIFTEGMVKKNYSTFIWGKLIKREVYLEALNVIPLTYSNMAEDILQYFFISRFAKKYVGINQLVSFYRTDTGMSSRKKIEDLEHWKLICSTASVFTILFTWINELPDEEKLQEDEIQTVRNYSYNYIKNNILQLKTAVVPQLQEEARALLCEYWGESFVNRVEKENNLSY